MRTFRPSLGTIFCLCTAATVAAAAPPAPTEPTPPSPLPPPGIRVVPASPDAAPQPGTETEPAPGRREASLYSIGTPSDMEQLLVEMVNRARAQPTAEGVRLANSTHPEILKTNSWYRVDLDALQEQFATLDGPLPPLSINPALTRAARLHSQDMLDNAFQGHVSSMDPPAPNRPGDSMLDRAQRQGYTARAFSENVYAFAADVEHAHAAFEVDWGSGTHGMQVPPSHRLNVHYDGICEIGAGIVTGTTTDGQYIYGPLLVTQNFGAESDTPAFITGVAHFDQDNDAFYDIGEGIGGIRVDVAGSEYYAVTSGSGGYSVPVPGDGTYEVRFHGLGLDHTVTGVSVTEEQNLKVDFRPAYQPPSLTAAVTPLAGYAAHFAITPSPGAMEYILHSGRLRQEEWQEGAEDGGVHVILANSPGYAPISDGWVDSGNYAFRLVHTAAAHQTVTIDRVLQAGPDTELRFSKRLGYATEGEVAVAQISHDLGATWVTVWTQAGAMNTAETAFTEVNIPLAEFAGQPVMVRIRYEYRSGSYYSQADMRSVGFYFDNLQVTHAPEIVDGEEIRLPGTNSSVALVLPEAARYVLRLAPVNGDHRFPGSDGLIVDVLTGEPATVVAQLDGPDSARWKLLLPGTDYDSGWQTQTDQVHGLLPGTYRVEFLPVTGYLAPLPHPLEIAPDNGQAIVTAAYELPGEDADDDGLPDDWERTVISADPDDAIQTIEDVLPDDDFDEDGATNFQEFENGTGPTVFDLRLVNGWNLVSIPRQLTTRSSLVQDVFPSSRHGSGWTWQAYYYAGTATVEPGTPFWVELQNAPASTPFPGARLPAGAQELPAGWNLVAVPTAMPYPENLDTRGPIWNWNNQAKSYEAVSRERDGMLRPGTAYWLFLESAGTLQPGANAR